MTYDKGEQRRDAPRALLDDIEKSRLEVLAPHFGFQFKKQDDECFVLQDYVACYEEELPCARAHTRLLVEIASRCAPWIYFNFSEPCHRTLLKHTDEKLLRIAELYAKSRMPG